MKTKTQVIQAVNERHIILNIYLFILGIIIATISYPAFSQEWDEEKPHHLSVFTGGTHMLEEDANGVTLGLDYEYRVNHVLGVGFVVEHAFEELDADTYLAVADIHTPMGIIMQVGPGIEFGKHHDRFIFRIGGLYEFEYESWTVSPQFHYDMAENADDSLVFGFAFGKAF